MKVVVVGGGVIGAACAYYLSRAGHAVTVLDQGTFGRGCSHGNCGLVCPSHVLPLAVPGAVRGALKALLSPRSPFRIRPGLNLSLWAWLYQFARRCNTADMMAAGRGIQALLNASRRLYDELLRDEGLACEWESRGLLFVFQTRQAFEHYGETDRVLREAFAMPATRYDGDAVCDLEPALKPGLAGGWYYQAEAHLRPDRLMAEWRRVLEGRGVVIREDCAARQFVSANGNARAVVTDAGEVDGEAFIVAAGAWTPLLQRELGCTIPIQPGKGYSITMARPATCPAIPLIFEEHRVVATPFASGYRLGSMMEFAGYDAVLDPRRLALLRRGAEPYLHEPYAEPVQEEWFGWRPMTPDGLPRIGPSPALANVVVAAGHNMLGLSMAPGTGKLVAELLGGTSPRVDPRPYALRRQG